MTEYEGKNSSSYNSIGRLLWFSRRFAHGDTLNGAREHGSMLEMFQLRIKEIWIAFRIAFVVIYFDFPDDDRFDGPFSRV